MEWAWNNEVIEFTHNDLLNGGVVSYRGNRWTRVRAASASLHHMWKAGLLTRLSAGKGRRATLYSPIPREEYQRKLKQLVLI
ncbi:MAG: hypothetical protein QMD95_04110 [Candidatus Hodarchaeaceae archaeon]|nr:hypothetical protein [Candidatus Hodarchaeaceae archaeon]